MAPGLPSPAASAVGASRACGIASLRKSRCKPTPQARLTDASTTWMAPLFERTSMLLVQKGDPGSEALGYSRGGFSTKVHIRAEGNGKLMTLVLTPGQRHESTQLPALMEQGAVKRPGRGRPRLRPDRIVGDRATATRISGAICASVACESPSLAARSNISVARSPKQPTACAIASSS